MESRTPVDQQEGAMVATDKTRTRARIRDSIMHRYSRQSSEGVILEHLQPSIYPTRDRIVVIIPAYNEERFIGSVVLCSLNYAATVIVVDDGSTDRTPEIAFSAGADVIQHKKNLGKGAALNSGFHLARELGPDAIVLIDGDGQHNPDDIPELVKPILEKQADMVIVEGDPLVNLNALRRVVWTIIGGVAQTPEGWVTQ